MFTIYAHYRIGWGITEVGLSLGLVGFLNITVQGLLVKRFITRFGERAALIVGLLAGAAGLAVWGLAFSPILFIVAIFVFAPIGLLQPALQSLMTRYVRPSEQGQLQGANASINGLTAVIGPILYGVVWAASIQGTASSTFPGLVFFLAAVLMLASVALTIRVTRGPVQIPAASGPAAVSGGDPPTPQAAFLSDEAAEHP
jgi:DHA1 family tetracycline resistance protein-like MFS transporter